MFLAEIRNLVRPRAATVSRKICQFLSIRSQSVAVLLQRRTTSSQTMKQVLNIPMFTLPELSDAVIPKIFLTSTLISTEEEVYEELIAPNMVFII